MADGFTFMPYDPPSQSAWSEAPGVDGYASYKVANTVTSHQAYGLGVYAVFINSTNISCFDAIETPTNPQQVNVHHMMDVYITGNTSGGGTSEINNIINGAGGEVGPSFATAYADQLWLSPMFNIGAVPDLTGTNIVITFPTGSWHAYQLQFENLLRGSNWSNWGGTVAGNDALESISIPISTTNQFYRVVAF